MPGNLAIKFSKIKKPPLGGFLISFCYNIPMNIFKQISKSIYGPDFYSGLTSQATGQAIKYFAKLLLIISLIATIILSVLSIGMIKFVTSEKTKAEVISTFPAELTLTIKDGKFSTNVSEPYILNLTKDRSAEDPSDLVINTKIDKISAEEFATYNASAILMSDSIATLKDGALNVQQIPGLPDMVVNQGWISDKVNWLSIFASKMIWVLPIIIYIFVYLFGLNFLLVNFVMALFVWGLLALLKKEQGYKHAYQVSLYASTLPNLIASVIPINFLPKLVLALIVVFVNFKNKSE